MTRIQVDIGELIRRGRFGPLECGATQDTVRAALGEPDTKSAPGALVEPMSIWVYGKSLCRGHLEFHFRAEELWMIFADYLPLRRIRSPRFCFEPGCLGGLTFPAAAEVRDALADGEATAPRWELLDPRWSDPPPPASGPRIGTRQWNKVARKTGAKDIDSASYAQLVWPSGASLQVGYHHAVTASGERIFSEDVILVMTVPMQLD